MIYDKEYFIQKFEAIPADQICQGNLESHCALWHCGVREENRKLVPTEEAIALGCLLSGVTKQDADSEDLMNAVWMVNDKEANDQAKENILEALKAL